MNLGSLGINVTIRVPRTAYPALTLTIVTYVKTDGTATTVVIHALSTVYRVVRTPRVTNAFRDGSGIFVKRSARVAVEMVFVASRMARVFRAFVRQDFTEGNVTLPALKTASRVQTSMPVTCVAMVGTATTVVTRALSTVYRVVQTPRVTDASRDGSGMFVSWGVRAAVAMVFVTNRMVRVFRAFVKQDFTEGSVT